MVDFGNEGLTEKREMPDKVFVQKQSTVERKILLPPSAFTVPLSLQFQTDPIQIANQPSTSFKNGALTESKPLKTSKEKPNETRKCEIELVELKKRLELLYDKSEKLK